LVAAMNQHEPPRVQGARRLNGGGAHPQGITARELQLMEFPPISYVVPGLVGEGLTLLAGKPKMGKSWLALDWSLAAAYGGMACGSIQCDQGDVLYCALEDNYRRLKSRMTQLLPDADLPHRLTLWTSMARRDKGGFDELRWWAEAAQKPRLIVIDTLACVRARRSAKDNAYETDYAALSPLQQLASELSLAVVVVHHLRKLESDDPLDAISGTTGLAGAADSVLVLRRIAEGITLYGRGRDIEDIESAMQFSQRTGQWLILGAASEVRKSDQRKSITEALRDGELSVAQLVAVTRMRRGNLDTLLHKMVKDGDVARPATGRYKLP
jgi:RecA-family ATPase